MLKIQFDHQIFSMQHYGGISRYFANIQHYLKVRPQMSYDNGILYSTNYYVKDDSRLSPFLGNALLRKNRKLHKWNRKYDEYLITKNEFDIFHPTYYNPYFLDKIKKPYVLTVHDMIHELLPEYFDPGEIFVNYKRRCIENAAHIIAISQSTKDDLKRILGVEDSKISVIHHGFMPQLSDPENNKPHHNYGHYLLYVGERRGYKNFPRFVSAIAPLLKKNSDLKLICAGGGPFQSAEKELLLRLKIEDKVVQKNVSDEDLSSLYKHAAAFVFPALLEGFGLPILEAFQNNCPVIASSNACFKEIGKKGINYFDPYNEHDILNSIEQVLHNKEKAKILTHHGQQQLTHFPMADCMHKTMSIYESIANIPNLS